MEDLYPSYWLKAVHEDSFPKQAWQDHLMVEKLIERMGGCAVFCAGSADYLYRGNIERLDPERFFRTAMFSDETVVIPARCAAAFFSGIPETGEADLAALCAKSGGKLQRFIVMGQALAVLCPADHPGFEDPDATDGHFTNWEYLCRMAAFFTPGMNVPTGHQNIRSTRKVVVAYEYPADAVDYRTQHYPTAYSPAILHGTRSGKDVLYLLHEETEVVNWEELKTVAKLHISYDRGETWTPLAEKEHLHWPHPLLVGETLYLYGANEQNHEFSIVRLEEGGLGDFISLKSVLEDERSVPPDDREKVFIPIRTGAMLWAAAEDDLTQARNWHYAPCELLDEAWFRAQTKSTNRIDRYTTMEGNVVRAPDGSLCNIMRVCGFPSSETNGYAALIKYKEDLSRAEFFPDRKSLVDMPTCRSRFIVRFDEKTGLYITFTALPVLEKSWPFMQRNVIAMTVSENLVDWEIVDIVLSDWAMENRYVSSFRHGFNYVYWTVLDDDMYLAVREATGPHTSDFHDGTYLTTYKIADYAAFIRERRTRKIYRFRE